MTWSVNQMAARAVALHGGGTTAERRVLLDMLGLIDPAGTVAPDDRLAHTPIEAVNAYEPNRFSPNMTEPRPKNCTTPPGLLALILAPKPEPKLVRKPRPAKVPEPATVVVPATPEPTPKAKAKAVTKAKPVQAGECGTPGGRSRHQRAGEPVCAVCKADDAKRSRERRAARKAQGVSGEYSPNPGLPARPETCGSWAGRSNHNRRGERLCPACAKFYAAHCKNRDGQPVEEPREERSA